MPAPGLHQRRRPGQRRGPGPGQARPAPLRHQHDPCHLGRYLRLQGRGRPQGLRLGDRLHQPHRTGAGRRSRDHSGHGLEHLARHPVDRQLPVRFPPQLLLGLPLVLLRRHRRLCGRRRRLPGDDGHLSEGRARPRLPAPRVRMKIPSPLGRGQGEGLQLSVGAAFQPRSRGKKWPTP